MISDLRELYQEVIIDHSRNPRNFHCLANADRHAEGFNPLCGDRLTLYLEMDDETIKEASFEGCGCAISTASASLMTETIKGKTVAEVESLFQDFHQLLTQNKEVKDLGKLQILAGVKQFPMRVKCATLAWHTLCAALKSKEAKTVSTE
jgi:nitrogen fixation NifU-like protein